MSDCGICPSVEASDVAGSESKSTSMSVRVKGYAGVSRVSHSNEKGYLRRQPQRAVPDVDTWHKVQSAQRRGCTNVSNDGDFSRENVMPPDDSINNSGQPSGFRSVESHKDLESTRTAPIKSSMNTDPPNATQANSRAEKTPKNKKVLHSSRFGFPLNSVKGMINSNSTGRFCSNLRLSPHLHHQARTESKAPDEGILGKVVRYCHIRHARDQKPHRSGHVVVPKPKIKRSRLSKQPKTTSSTPDRECNATCSDLSAVTSILSMQRSCDTKSTSTTHQGSENEDQLLAQIAAQVQHMQLPSESASTHERDTIAVEPHPALLVTSPELGVQHSEEKGNLPSLSPLDEVNTLTSVTDVSITHRPVSCEDDVRAEVTLADGAKQETNPGFGSQNFMHFTTTISPPLRKMIQIAPGVIQRNITPQLTPYGQVTRCMPIKSQLRTNRPRTHYQVAPTISVIMSSNNRPFLRKQFIKKSFFLPESANLEDILADADDRRIIAICNRFHCEMVAFSKVPRKGSMKHEVILSAGRRDDIARCARCLDARLNWCISPQLD